MFIVTDHGHQNLRALNNVVMPAALTVECRDGKEWKAPRVFLYQDGANTPWRVTYSHTVRPEVLTAAGAQHLSFDDLDLAKAWARMFLATLGDKA